MGSEMNCTPNIGDRVYFPGNSAIGPCVGVVTKVYREFEWDEDLGRDGALLPEREWHVAMKPDALPEQWPYEGADTFAPAVKELRAAR